VVNVPFGNVFVKRHVDEEPVVVDPQETPATDLPDGLIDSVEAATLLGVTGNNLRQMVHKGQLVAVGKRHRRALFRRDDVVALAEARRAKRS
jgi:excisionase family DNA binding protein